MLSVLRIISFLVFIFLIVVFQDDSESSDILTAWETYAVIILINQLVFRWNIVDLIIGGFLIFISLWLLINVIIDDHQYSGTYVPPSEFHNALVYIPLGFGLVAGVTIVWAYFVKRSNVKSKKALQKS